MTLESNDSARVNPEIQTPETHETNRTDRVSIAELRRDPDLNCRAKISQTVVNSYAEAMISGTEFPPIAVFKDRQGVLWVADGFHRSAAAERAGLIEIAADIRDGSRKDALLFAASANAKHGLQRTTADKKRAVLLLLAEPAWAKRADNWVAKHAAVSHTFVAKIRSTCSDSSAPVVRETSDGRVMDTARIGSKNAPDIDQLVAKFRSILRFVTDENRSAFGEKVLAILTESTA